MSRLRPMLYRNNFMFLFTGLTRNLSFVEYLIRLKCLEKTFLFSLKRNSSIIFQAGVANSLNPQYRKLFRVLYLCRFWATSWLQHRLHFQYSLKKEFVLDSLASCLFKISSNNIKCPFDVNYDVILMPRYMCGMTYTLDEATLWVSEL